MPDMGTGRVVEGPQDTVSRIADVGMGAMRAKAKEEGVELGNAIIFASLVEAPAGEADATTHPRIRSEYRAMPTAVDVVAFAVTHVRSLARAAGVPLDLKVGGDAAPLPRRPRGRHRGR